MVQLKKVQPIEDNFAKNVITLFGRSYGERELLAFMMVAGYLLALAVSYMYFTGPTIDGSDSSANLILALPSILCLISGACLSRLAVGKLDRKSKILVFCAIMVGSSVISVGTCYIVMYAITWK